MSLYIVLKSTKTKIVAFALALFGIPLSAITDGRSNCAEDLLGNITCAPPGGIAVTTLQDGVLCAPGQCVSDNLGHLKCSSETGGGAQLDNLGRAVCNGGCVSPKKEYCKKIDGEKGEPNS